ncbi:hypothetical protein RFM99_20590 [Mesorhizobium sp. VK4C]|uniref:hypothetical protein n=1 Tax=Mesorhizobium captivum TaxID=3072319 RepID=UPI002A2449CF|nr:hypothetical protein [Mesorhizobium sp. VK4C]MDX8500803.1 hypothetical protein [Mesorhizobium sp. VK4C]
MNKQMWKSSRNSQIGHCVRVIEDGAVSIKGFGSEADATAFANSERAKLGLDTPVKK